MITSTEKLSKLIKSLPTLRVVNREKVELIGSLIVVELMTICVLRVPCLSSRGSQSQEHQMFENLQLSSCRNPFVFMSVDEF